MLVMASSAEAIPQLYTFTGTVTFAQTCFTGEFAPPCEVGEPGGIVSYTFVVDLARPGERSVRNSSGETITPIAGTFFAAFPFPGDTPLFGVVGPEPRIRVDENFGNGSTLHSFIGIESEEFGSFMTESSRHVLGFPGATLTIGAHFEGHQADSIHAPGGITGRLDEIASVLTLTEIHGVPEPGVFLLAGLAFASLLAASIARRRSAG
jgi:hypothetical protein